MERTNTLKIITVSAVIFLLLLVTALIINVVKLANVNAKKRELAAQLAEVERQISENSDTIDYISTDAYIDQYAREYLNMTGENEEAFTGK